jgi:hypothetical protein
MGLAGERNHRLQEDARRYKSVAKILAAVIDGTFPALNILNHRATPASHTHDCPAAVARLGE